MNYFAPGYDTIPEDWYFDKIEPMPNKEGILLERINETYFQQLFEERENIRQTIKNFRKLPEELQEIAIKKWPEELHKPLKKQLVGFKGPKVIANHIIAIRWGIKEDAVERNIKRLKKKKRNNRSKN